MPRKRQKRRPQNARKAVYRKGRPVKRRTAEEQARYLAIMRLRRKRRRRRRRLMLGCALLLFLVVLRLFASRTYHSYRVLERSSQEDIISNSYVEIGDSILKYSPEGASLQSKELQAIWSDTYTMANPRASVNGSYAVIADQDGTSMVIYDRKGKLGSITTSYSIVKATISSKGLVAAILDGGDDTWINFYSSDGSLVVENQTRIDDPGYPMDVAISDNGVIMMVAYQYVDGSQTTSYVAFYNFGDVGQNEDDRIVSGFTYDGTVVPEVEYLGENRCVAMREDGFTIYGGSQIPKEIATVTTDQEIVTTFHSREQVGLVFKNDDKKKMYTMQVYDKDGKLQFTKDFNVPYTKLRVSNGSIIMYNSSQICVMNNRGAVRFRGDIDGTVEDFFKIGWNRFLLVLDNGVQVIKLK